MDLISVIVPVYNVEQYLNRCVESIQNQTYQNLEIILVDDGSPDNCPQICDELETSDSRIKVIHKLNEGAGFARNAGLGVATGDYVTFIDSDDWISQTHIENLYCAIKDSKADVAVGGHTCVCKDGTHIKRYGFLEKRLYKGDDKLYKIILPLIGTDFNQANDFQVQSSGSMNLYGMETIRNHNLRFVSERDAISEDTYFNIDYFNLCKGIVAVSEIGYFYYENEASISRKYNPQRFQRTLNYYKKMKEQIEKYQLDDKVGYRVERSFLMKIRVSIRHIIFSNLSRKEKMQEIRAILANETTQKVLAIYPIETFVFGIYLLTILMRHKNATGVYYLIKIREIAKNQMFLKKFIKLFGIER